MNRFFWWLLSVLVVAVATPAWSQTSPTPAPPDTLNLITIPDSLAGQVIMPVVDVSAPLVRAEPNPDRSDFSEGVVTRRDPVSAASLVPLMPASLATTNSRGETVIQMRGAPERQVRIFRDDIPLNLPWDERADLSTLPGAAIGSMTVERGPGSVLNVPNTLGGTVKIKGQRQTVEGWKGLLQLTGGEVTLGMATGSYGWRSGPWEAFAAVNYRRRNGFLLWSDFIAPYNQIKGSQTRTNSDGKALSGVVRVGRDLNMGGQVGFSFHGYGLEKGVPAETNTSDARFWRYPDSQRGLFAVDLEMRPDQGRSWQLDGTLSVDLSHLEIRDFADSTYTGPALQPGVPYETNDDRTGYARIEYRRPAGSTTVGIAGSVRYTRHNESTVYEGPTENYSQWLGGLAGEWKKLPAGGWGFRVGAGLDGAATPETGDKPVRDPLGAPAISLRGMRDLGTDWSSFLQVARRSRFPSLRELYSGALGKFVPNPDLRPEVQNSVELGLSFNERRASMGLTGFVYLTEDGIVKESLGGGQFQRVNQDEIGVLGAEFTANLRPLRGMRLEGHYTYLYARAKGPDGEFDVFVDNRPEYISFVSFSQATTWGGQAGVELILVGPRYDQGVRLGGQSVWNVRVAYDYVSPSVGLFSSTEVFARVENIFDRSTWSQLGLPGAGREFRMGIAGRFGR